MEKFDFSLFVEINSPEGEIDFIDSNPCTCSDQTWTLKERTLLLQEKDREYFVRKVFCNICGRSNEFYFNAPFNTYIVEKKIDQPRELHYLFAHRLLPEFFFEDPEGFVYVLKEKNATERLLSLWKGYNTEIVNSGGENLRPEGLQSEIVKIKSWEGVVIIMPEAKFVAEASFIACMISEDATQYRYFIYEFTFPDKLTNNTKAVLCEWLAGKRRRNLNREGPVQKEAFFSFIEEELNNEEDRANAGAKPISVPTWDMIEESDPSMTYFGNEAYRHHICLFAFHILPSICSKGQLDFSDKNSTTQILKYQWEQLGNICQKKGYTKITWEGMSCDVLQYQSANFLFLRFPKPLSPPEPYFAAFKIGDTDKIYFLEKNTTTLDNAFFTSISGGSHGIQGEIDHAGENAFFGAIDGKFNRDSSMSTLPHLIYYIEISSIYEKISS